MEAFDLRGQDGLSALATKMTYFSEIGSGSECLGLSSQNVRQVLSPCSFALWMGIELGDVAQFSRLALGSSFHLLFITLLPRPF